MEHRSPPPPPARSPPCTPSPAARSRSARCSPSCRTPPRSRGDRIDMRPPPRERDQHQARSPKETVMTRHSKPKSTRPSAPPSPPSATATAATYRPADEHLWAGGGQARLPRRQPARGVRRRRRRHRRTLHRPGGAGRRRLPPADDGRLPAICGTVIARFGTEEQKQRLAPRPRRRHPHHGLRHHRTRRRLQLATASPPPPAATDTGDWLLTGRKVFISGVDIADATLIVGRTEDARTGSLKPCLFIVPRDAQGFTARQIDMELQAAEKQFELVLDDVRLPADALVGDEDAGLLQLFAGLNPERIMTAAFAHRHGPLRPRPAVEYATRPHASGRRPSAPTRPSPTRSPRRTSSSNSPA